MGYPARTIDGETVNVVEKRIEDGSRAMESTVLVADDGREFGLTGNGLVLTPIGADPETGEVAPAPEAPKQEPEVTPEAEATDETSTDEGDAATE